MQEASSKQTSTEMQVLNASLQQGLLMHQKGQLAEAEAIYAQILKQEPRQADAQHLRGVIALQRKRPKEALEYISRAIHINPDVPEFYSNFGTALKQLDRAEEALASYDKAIALKPDFADALSNRGGVLNQLNRPQEALASIDKALAYKLNCVEAHFNRGNALKQLGRLEDALASFDKSIGLKPKYIEAHSNRGSILKQLGRVDEALACFDQAIAINPIQFEAYSNRGNALLALQRADEALASYDKALALYPDFVEAHSNRGNVLNRLGRSEEALASLDKALALNPNFAGAHSNRGTVLSDLGRISEALLSFEEAIALNPLFAEAHNNLGNTYLEFQRTDEALNCYKRALELTPDFAEARWNLAFTLLLRGEFESGWALFESRKNVSAMEKTLNIRKFNEPLWLGSEKLTGKTVLLHAEQGLGDTLQFCRYAKCVQALGAKVLLEVPAPLTGLLSGLAGVDALIEQGQVLPTFDYQCPLLSLPLAFKTTLETIPNSDAYLTYSPKKRHSWQQRLGTPTKPRIGLVWSGNPRHKNDHHRSLVLAELIEYLPKIYQYVSLQNDIRETDREVLRTSGIAHYESDILDFTDTAALCSLMDIVISVDTSVAHLAGAIGKTTWLLLPYAPDWRWMQDRGDSPWYGSVKLYRQTQVRKWAPVLQQVTKDLLRLTVIPTTI